MRPSLAPELTTLESARLIQRLESESELEYFFRHGLIQEAAYTSLLKSDRRVLHGCVAEILESVYQDNPEEGYGLLAYHYQQAEIPHKAQEYLFKAGEQARTRYANQDAIRFYTDALALTPASEPDQRYRILQARERVYDVIGARAAQWQDLETLSALIETLPADPGRRATLLLRQGDYADKTGEYLEARRLAHQAIGLAQTAEQAEVEAQAHFQWGISYWRTTEYATARTGIDRARALAQAYGFWALAADSVRMLGVLDDSQSDFAAARLHFEEALRLKRSIGDRRGESQALNSLGIVAFHQNDFEAAQKIFEQALSVKRLLGDRIGESITLQNLSNVLVQVGRLTEAEAQYAQALTICQAIHDPDGEASALVGLSQVRADVGQFDAARGYFERALVLFRNVGDREGEADTLAGLGALAYTTHNLELALTFTQQAQAIAQELSNEYILGYALTMCGHIWLALGHRVEAQAAYTRAIQLRRAMAQTSLVIESVAGLANVRRAEGRQTEALVLVEEILTHLAVDSLNGTEDPFQIYLTAYHLLRDVHDPRADHVLASGRAALMARAALISDDEMRRSFLENVPSHQELLQLCLLQS